MNQPLNALEAQYYYDNLRLLAQNTHTYKDNMRQLHNLLLSILNLLTEQRERQIFTGWFAKISFLAQAYNLGNEREQQLQSLRRLLRRSVVSTKFQATEEHFLIGLKMLTELVADFSENPPSEALIARYAGKELPELVFKDVPQDRLQYLYATIREKGTRDKDSKGVGKIILECDTEDFGKIQITVQDIPYYNTQTGAKFRTFELSAHCVFLVKPHQLVCFTNIEKLEEGHFATTMESLMIVNPDYLIDATAIANCFLENNGTPIKSAYINFLKRISFFEGSQATFSGNIINQLLDKLLERPLANFEELYTEIWQGMELEAAMLDLKNAELSHTRNQAEGQFNTLQKIVDKYKDKHLTTEPTFISNRYGLQGRLDLLIEYDDQATRKDIVELKSGKFPNAKNTPAKPEHLAQVACYNMLIDSTFQERNGVSSILYSQDVFSPLRDCGKLNFEMQDASWIRNCIVFLDGQLAYGKPEIYDTILKKLENFELPAYTVRDINAFAQRWRTASSLDQAYYAVQMGLVAREQQVAKVGGVSGTEPAQGFAGLWRNTPAEKMENFSILYPLVLDAENSNFKNGEITFFRHTDQGVSAFRAGDIMLVYPVEDVENPTPQRYQLLKGNILEIHPNRVKLKIWNKALDANFFTRYVEWAVEPNLMEGGYGHQYASLTTFLGATDTHKERIYGLLKPRFDENFKTDYTHTLSENQNQILNRALASRDYFLLQGPPGTGKTSKMLRNMVHYLYHHTQEKIVLLAFTNRATDEICQKVGDACDGDFVRLGNAEEQDTYYEKSLKSVEGLENMRATFRNKRVFVSTVASFYRYINLLQGFDTLIIDEASQLLEPALVGILPNFKRFILIGDEKQLPAVVTQPLHFCKVENDELNAIGIYNLSHSLFERLLLNAQNKGWHHAYTMLDTQYRTHEDIAQFISKEFYKTLQIGSARQKEPFSRFNPNSNDVLEAQLAKGRLQFWESPQEPHFKFHQAEASAIVKILQTIRRVYGADFTTDTVGVITPYRAQMAEIFKQLDDELRYFVTVDTVERYQGSERDIILISMAVNHRAQMRNLQALNHNQTVDKKLNVALSRAREQLIILGSPKVLDEGVFYKKLLSSVEVKYGI